MKDLLVAFSRTKKTKQVNQGDNNNFTIMRVNELRMKLDEKGLNVDGSREAMIETLKGSANGSADDDDSLEEASFQNVKHTKRRDAKLFYDNTNRGWKDFCRRSSILFISKNILDDNGTLAVVVSIKGDAASPFVPSNPMSSLITSLLLDEETADVWFEVGSADVHDVDEAASSPVTFHAHRLIIKKCAPMLASLFGSDGEHIATASINDVKPAIFRHLLHYVYGGSVPGKEMNAHAKDIINAADKYSIVNLKLEAEAAYVKSTKITMENAMDNLLYADALNLALLKEIVVDFLAENHDEAIGSLSFTDVPSYLMKDLMVAFGRKMKKGTNEGSKDGLNTMHVSELRMKLAKVGLDVDGSREAMIEALNANANELAVDSNKDSESDEDSESDGESDDGSEEWSGEEDN
eukprot:scaffold32969_cov78-Skeletonema_marinoi.AAC.1